MSDETRKIQEKCLEILEITDEICRKHCIQYSLCGGSVVGAHLYGGCLPWDDDIDLMMTRDNYNRFLRIAPQELPDGFSIHNYQLSEEYWSLFTKIVNDNTTIVQNNGSVCGVFLDITVYDKIPNNWKKKEDFFWWKVSQVVDIGIIKPRSVKDIFRNIILSLFFKNKKRFYLFFQHRVEKNGHTLDYEYSELFGAYCNTKPYEASIFENYSEIFFEGKQYMIVRDYIRYLETRYERTDFHEPKDRQIAPHYQMVDFSLPYKKYLERRW